LIDHDTVELTNITSQGYRHTDIGIAKVKATRESIAQIDPEIEVDSICDRYRPRMVLGSVVFVCVDSIDTRAAIFRGISGSCQSGLMAGCWEK